MIIQLEGISKSFGRTRALNEVSLTINSGDCLGIIGPNGSGKTTLINIVLGLLNQDQGTYTVDGVEFKNIKAEALKSIGAVMEIPRFYPTLSARNNLTIIARTCGLANESGRIDSTLDFVDLTKHANRQVAGFSLGMKQRLGIAAALLTDPQILVFDEPTNGLDPEGIRLIRLKILELCKSGKTVILCSHLMSEVQQVCTRFAIMSAGRILKLATQSEISGGQARSVLIGTKDIERLRTYISQNSIGTIAQEQLQLLTINVKPEIPNEELLERLVRDGLRISSFTPAPNALEDYFTSVMSKE